jgi:hypothetical protein
MRRTFFLYVFEPLYLFLDPDAFAVQIRTGRFEIKEVPMQKTRFLACGGKRVSNF